MFNLLGQLGTGFTGLVGSIVNTRQTNKTNLQIARETNAANRELVEMQNQAAKEEAELAYKRSSAGNQVNLMRGAGMSRAGAINALNGGGSYTPAPVNTSQDSAPQMQTTDLSALTNIAQAFAQRAQQKHDEKMQAKQLEEQKRQFDETLKLEREKFFEDKIDKGYDRVVKQFQADILHSDSAIRNLEYLQKQFTHNEEINAHTAELIARRSQAILDDMRGQKLVEAMSKMSQEDLDNLFELQATLNMLQQGLQYDSTSAMIKGAKKLISLIGGAKTSGAKIKMH